MVDSIEEYPLPEYNSDIKLCPKCEGPFLVLMWRPPTSDLTSEDTRLLGEWDAPEQEHFRRQCNSCNFYWYEGPKQEANE